MSRIEVECWEEGVAEWRENAPHSRTFHDIAFELFFATPEMAAHPLLRDVKVFGLYFGAQQQHVLPLPQYAPIFAHVLDGLMGEQLTAVISIDAGTWLPVQKTASSRVIYRQATLSGWVVEHELNPNSLR